MACRIMKGGKSHFESKTTVALIPDLAARDKPPSDGGDPPILWNFHVVCLSSPQDLAGLDIDLAAITQAGGWKSTRMPLQYAEKINAARSGMARAAEKTGRDSSDPFPTISE
jgi:hypothetical protein